MKTRFVKLASLLLMMFSFQFHQRSKTLQA